MSSICQSGNLLFIYTSKLMILVRPAASRLGSRLRSRETSTLALQTSRVWLQMLLGTWGTVTWTYTGTARFCRVFSVPLQFANSRAAQEGNGQTGCGPR